MFPRGWSVIFVSVIKSFDTPLQHQIDSYIGTEVCFSVYEFNGILNLFMSFFCNKVKALHI